MVMVSTLSTHHLACHGHLNIFLVHGLVALLLPNAVHWAGLAEDRDRDLRRLLELWVFCRQHATNIRASILISILRQQVLLVRSLTQLLLICC